MAAPIKPGKKTVLGKTAYWLVPTLTTTGPLATEINATGALNVTCYLLGDQAAPSGDTGKVDLPRLLCETSTTETLDVTKVTLPDFRFLWDPQAASSANDKKAWTLVKDGFAGYMVRRQNVISALDATVSAAQFVDWFQVQGSIGIPTESASDASGLYTFDVSFASLAFGFNVAVA